MKCSFSSAFALPYKAFFFFRYRTLIMRITVKRHASVINTPTKTAFKSKRNIFNNTRKMIRGIQIDNI